MSTNVLNLWSNQVGNSYCPQVKLEIWKTSEDATKVYYDWYMYYVTYGYAAYTNGYSRSVTATVGGDTLTGSININGVTGTKLINSGSSWLGKQHSTRTVSCSVSMYFDVSWNGTYAEYVSKSGSFTIGQQTSYTVSYNTNGGSGAPSNQTKWHGENLTLSSTKPTRTGYSFKNWNTKADGSGTTYASGGGYTGNAALILYAQWTANTYTVKYDANGGTGAPANQTKTYGVDLTLSTTKPTRTNYNFLGWSTSSTATSAQYASGGKYTANSAVTLYAVWELAYWKPKITNLSAIRCASDGTADDFNTYAKVTFNYELCQLTGSNTPKTITIGYKLPTASSYTNTTVTATATSGTISQVIGGSLDINNSYDILVTVTDTKDGSTSLTTSISSSVFAMDILSGGKGVAFGKAADKNGLEVAWNRWYSKPAMFHRSSGQSGTAGYVKICTLVHPGAYSNTGMSLVISQRGKRNSIIHVQFTNTPNTDIAGIDIFSVDGPANVYGVISGAKFDVYVQKSEAWDVVALVDAWSDTVAMGNWLDTTTDFAATLPSGYQTAKKAYMNQGNAYLFNGCSLYEANTSGTYRSLALINSSNNTYFGNGSYANSEGSTYYQGNTVGIQAKGHIYMTAPSAGLSARAFGVNKVLASTASYMNDDQTITLSEGVSAQPNGIVLVWSLYSGGAAANSDWSYFFVPKTHVANHPGQGLYCSFVGPWQHMGKYVYVKNTEVVGHTKNDETVTIQDVTMHNAVYVLRYVIGV